MEEKLLFSSFLCRHVLDSIAHGFVIGALALFNFRGVIIRNNPMIVVHHLYGHSEFPMLLIIKSVLIQVFALLIIGRVKEGE